MLLIYYLKIVFRKYKHFFKKFLMKIILNLPRKQSFDKYFIDIFTCENVKNNNIALSNLFSKLKLFLINKDPIIREFLSSILINLCKENEEISLLADNKLNIFESLLFGRKFLDRKLISEYAIKIFPKSIVISQSKLEWNKYSNSFSSNSQISNLTNSETSNNPSELEFTLSEFIKINQQLEEEVRNAYSMAREPFRKVKYENKKLEEDLNKIEWKSETVLHFLHLLPEIFYKNQFGDIHLVCFAIIHFPELEKEEKVNIQQISSLANFLEKFINLNEEKFDELKKRLILRAKRDASQLIFRITSNLKVN